MCSDISLKKLKGCHYRKKKKTCPPSLAVKCPTIAPVLWTLHVWSEAWGGRGGGKWKLCEEKKSLSVALLPLTALEVLQRGWKRKDQGWKGSYLELFDVRWGDKTTRRREKRPGGVGVSASWTWWGGKVNRVSDTRAAQKKSNLLKVAVLNKCQSENAASLFKSIRGLGLTVCGGRSPLLWGWGDFFFSLTKVLSVPIRWHRYFLLPQQVKNMETVSDSS